MDTNEAAKQYEWQKAREKALKDMDIIFPEGFKFEAGKKYQAVVSEVPTTDSSTKENIKRESTETMNERY